MKTKPILITAVIVLLAGLTLFIRCRTRQSADASEVIRFLYKFNDNIKAGNADSLLAFFEADKKTKALKRLVNLLAGKKGKNGEKPLAHIALDIDNAEIKNINAEIITASIPVNFSHDSVDNKQSILLLKIYHVAPHQYKIVHLDARQFSTDYVAYENYVKSKTIPDKDIYSEITLESFKTAKELRAKYDSVLWFEHVDGKTYYYVIKGKLNDHFYWTDGSAETQDPDFKMGLVNPSLKEIVPVEYNLVHNVGGTIDGLIEVEKGGKRGFYDLDGKNIVPASYDQIFPIVDDENIALLRNNDDYFYLRKDLSITDKIADFKITKELAKIKALHDSYTLSDKSSKNIMEFNSREDFNTMIISPSYLVDLQILPRFLNFQNPLRHAPAEQEGEGEGSISLDIKFDGSKKEESNWFESAFYSVVDDYLGARSGLYETKKLLVVDKKQNRIMAFNYDSYYGGAEGGGALSGMCIENNFHSINDTLFEFKTTSNLDQYLLNGEHLSEGPYYHYMGIRNGTLVSIPCGRIFACAKFVKMDDSYLQGCYVIDNKSYDHVTPEILSYIKNEIFASYGYKFKNEKWNEVFEHRYEYHVGNNTTVDDSLTSIEKYNISWINSKLNQQKSNTLAAK
ncbi:MAG TPA: YARHG domain-containing protein [Mucilaginibacter sp.]|jgi:hypothetical protein